MFESCKRSLISILVLACSAAAQTAPAAAREWTAAHRQQILDQFTSLLAIPNVASDTANIRRNAETLLGILKRRGVDARLLSISEASPVVYGEIRVPNAQHTIVFYAHYDGQPVTPADWVVEIPSSLYSARKMARHAFTHALPPTTKPRSSRN